MTHTLLLPPSILPGLISASRTCRARDWDASCVVLSRARLAPGMPVSSNALYPLPPYSTTLYPLPLHSTTIHPLLLHSTTSLYRNLAV
jgi:hypothetical protein